MPIKWIAAILFALGGSVAIPADARAEPEGNATDAPPELGVAIVVDGRTLEVHRFVERMVTRTTAAGVPPGVTIEVTNGSITPQPIREVVSVVETHITRIGVTKVIARRIDGHPVSHKDLMAELVRPTPVLLAKRAQQVNPLFSRLFKPESLILLLPSSLTPATVAPNDTTPANQPR